MRTPIPRGPATLRSAPAVELTVTAAGAAEVPEAVHPATSKPKAAAAASPTDVVGAVRLISI